MEIRELALPEWESALPDDGFEVFHVPAALRTLDRHAPGELRLFGGFKGQQAVGLLPVFVREAGLGGRQVGRVVTSPPPSMGVPHLGPLLMPTSPKRRKRERVNRRFTEGVLEALDLEDSRSLVRIVGHPEYSDPRPFEWNGLEYDTAFTYRLSVRSDLDGMLSDFSKSLRREINSGEELDVTVERAGRRGAREVYEDTRARYAEQDEPFGPSAAYVDDLVAALRAEDRARTYVARGPAGDFLGGVTALYSNDAAYYWLGGARTTHENVSINSLLHWAIIEDIAEDPPRESVDTYDLVGANTERLCRYKSKFGADLVPYYVVESGGTGLDVAKRAYRWFQGLGGTGTD